MVELFTKKNNLHSKPINPKIKTGKTMKINFGSQVHYTNRFSPLKTTQKSKKQRTYYKFYDEKDRYVGKFDLEDEGKFCWESNGKHVGYITGLEIPEWLRGKKDAINVLMNIKRLAYNEAMKRNMDIVHFAAANDNPNNAAKLYKRIFPEAVHKFSDGYTRFAVPLKTTSKEEAKQLLDDFEMIYRNTIANNEVEMPPIIDSGTNIF